MTLHIRIARKFDKTVLCCAAMLLVLAASLFKVPFVYLAFLLGAGVLMLVPTQEVFSVLLFLFSFAAVFKPASGSTSFFTYLELVAILRLLVTRKTTDGVFLVIILLLTAEVILCCSSVIVLAKLLIVQVLYYLFTVSYQAEYGERYFWFFFSGLVCSTTIGIFKEQIPRLLSLYEDLNYERISGELHLRFSGMFGDPNYFSIPIILCIVVFFAAVFQQKKPNCKWLLCLVALLVAGAATISKSFFLICGGVIFAVVIANRRAVGKKIFVAAFLIGIIFVNPGDFISNIVYRFSNYSLTTGRLDIWQNYIAAITKNAKSLVVGYGLDAKLIGRPQHSIVIEALYSIGLIGTLLYAATLFYVTKRRCLPIKRKLPSYLGYLTVFLQYLFLNGLTAYEMPFYLMISFIIFNNDYVQGNTIVSDSQAKGMKSVE